MNKWLKKNLLTVVLIACLIGFLAYTNITGSCPLRAFQTEQTYNLTGTPAPRWELPTLEGKLYNASELNGKVAIINFWATWCGPCIAELPDFIEVSKAYADKPVQFIGISMDQGDMSKVADFVEKKGIPYPIIIGDALVAAKFGGVNSIPSTFILKPDGTVAETHVGKLGASDLKDAIERYLPQATETQPPQY